MACNNAQMEYLAVKELQIDSISPVMVLQVVLQVCWEVYLAIPRVEKAKKWIMQEKKNANSICLSKQLLNKKGISE